MKPYQSDRRCLKSSVQLNQGTRKVGLLALKIILDRSPFPMVLRAILRVQIQYSVEGRFENCDPVCCGGQLVFHSGVKNRFETLVFHSGVEDSFETGVSFWCGGQLWDSAIPV